MLYENMHIDMQHLHQVFFAFAITHLLSNAQTDRKLTTITLSLEEILKTRVHSSEATDLRVHALPTSHLLST